MRDLSHDEVYYNIPVLFIQSIQSRIVVVFNVDIKCQGNREEKKNQHVFKHGLTITERHIDHNP